MKEFDFEHPDFKLHLPDNQEWLKANHNKPITEQQFVEWWVKRPRVDISGNSIRKASHKRSPSYARHKYRYLVKNYGLFQGGK